MHFFLCSLQFPWQLCVAWALVSPLRQASLCEVTNKTFSLFISPSPLQYKPKHFLLTIPDLAIHTGIIPVHSICPPLWSSGRVANRSVIMSCLVGLKSAIMYSRLCVHVYAEATEVFSCWQGNVSRQALCVLYNTFYFQSWDCQAWYVF